MSMMYIGVASVAIGAGAQVYGASQNRRASNAALSAQERQAQLAHQAQMAQLDYFKEAIAAFQEQAFALAGESKKETNIAYRRSRNIIDAIPEVSELMAEGKELSREDFDFRTGIKRENLDFILGDTEEDLRAAQKLNTSIAALDSADFQGRFGDIVKSSMFGLKADTVGDPYGTFSNLSAQNLWNFSREGLNASLQINDFFSREGTVDPISPLQTAFDLRTVAEREATMDIQNEQWRANSIAQINSGLVGALGGAVGAQSGAAQMGIGISQDQLNTFGNISNANLISQQRERDSWIQALGTLTSGIGQIYGLQTQRVAVNNQTALNNDFINRYAGVSAGVNRYSATTGYGAPPGSRSLDAPPIVT